MRAQWLHDMRIALEKNGLGWAMSDYRTEFALVNKANGLTTPDAAVIEALGLHEPKPPSRDFGSSMSAPSVLVRECFQASDRPGIIHSL
jgi:hypothetical protein